MWIFDEDDFDGVESPVSSQPFYVEGFVHIVHQKDPVLICRDMNSYKIPSYIVSKNKLDMGDWVECIVCYNTAVRRHLVTEVERVNGVSAHSKEARYPSFDQIESCAPSTVIKFDNHEIKLGTRILVDLGDSTDKISSMMNAQITGVNTTRIALIVDECDYCIKELTKAGFSSVFLTRPDVGLKKQITAALFAHFFAKSEAKNGKHVILFVESLSKLVRLYNKVNYKDTDGMIEMDKIYVGSLEDVKNLYLSSKQTVTGGSLTAVAFCHEPRTKMEEFIFTDFIELANKIIRPAS